MILTSIMILLALMHFYWALGGKFGLDKALPTDEQGNRLLNPSTFMTYVVAFILLGFAYVAYRLYVGDNSPIIVYAGYGLATLFFLRTVGDFNLVGLFKKVKHTKFAMYATSTLVNFIFLNSYPFFI